MIENEEIDSENRKNYFHKNVFNYLKFAFDIKQKFIMTTKPEKHIFEFVTK